MNAGSAIVRKSVAEALPDARSPNPLISVLIPTHHDAHFLRKSLPALLASGDEAIEIRIMNNDASQDVRATIGAYADDPRVRVLEMGFEAGFACAINRGIRESTGELVMFCNADVFPSPSYISRLRGFLNEHPHAGAAIGKLLRYDLVTDRPTDVIDTAGLLLTRQRRMVPRGEGECDVGQYDKAVEVFAVDGAAPVLRRSALDTISVEGEYLDENFFAHKEDHDVSWRLRLAGWDCWYVPSAVAHHGRTTRGLGSHGYLSAIRSYHENERSKPHFVRVHAMKNQWLMLLKNEDEYNFLRDWPYILGREGLVVVHNLLFAPRALVAIPMTLKILRPTLRKRRASKARQRLDPRLLRRWLTA